MTRAAGAALLFLVGCAGGSSTHAPHPTRSLEHPCEAAEASFNKPVSAKIEVRAEVDAISESTTGEDPQDSASEHEPERPLAPERDYAIRVGIGFSPFEVGLLERAAASWATRTGLPIHLRHGYGPVGNFHIVESIPVCGQSWVYDGFLGCYSPASDSVLLNRYGIELEAEVEQDLLYLVLVHELGHWLGLGHEISDEDSVMKPDLAGLRPRVGSVAEPSARDITLVCALNPCRLAER